jgi:hypothetical protein
MAEDIRKLAHGWISFQKFWRENRKIYENARLVAMQTPGWRPPPYIQDTLDRITEAENASAPAETLNALYKELQDTVAALGLTTSFTPLPSSPPAQPERRETEPPVLEARAQPERPALEPSSPEQKSSESEPTSCVPEPSRAEPASVQESEPEKQPEPSKSPSEQAPPLGSETQAGAPPLTPEERLAGQEKALKILAGLRELYPEKGGLPPGINLPKEMKKLEDHLKNAGRLTQWEEIKKSLYYEVIEVIREYSGPSNSTGESRNSSDSGNPVKET